METRITYYYCIDQDRCGPVPLTSCTLYSDHYDVSTTATTVTTGNGAGTGYADTVVDISIASACLDIDCRYRTDIYYLLSRYVISGTCYFMAPVAGYYSICVHARSHLAHT